MSAEAVGWALRQPIKSASLKLLLVTLADAADRERFDCWPSYRHLGEVVQRSKATVIRQISELEEMGLIAVESRTRGNGSTSSNRYVLSVGGGIKNETPRGSQKRYPPGHENETPGVSPVRPPEPLTEPLKGTALSGEREETGSVSAEEGPKPLAPEEAVTAAGQRYAAAMGRLGFQIPESPERGCAARLRALVAEHGAEGFLERWDRVLATVEAVPFLRGEGAKWDHAPIAWLAEKEARVLAGEYGEAAKGEGKAAGPVSVSPGTAVRSWTVSGAWCVDLGPPPDDPLASRTVRDAAAAFAGPARQAIQTRNVCDLPSTGPVAAAQRRLCERVRNAPPSERDTIAARVAALETHNEEKTR